MKELTIPNHVAIIMDGNGRWAKKKGLPRTLGHKEGIKALKRTIKDAYALGIKYLTAYVFSTENWKRPKEEVEFLMAILDKLIVKEVNELHLRGVKVKFLGELNDLSDALKKKIIWAEELTNSNTKMQLNLLVNYGSRQEIAGAIKKLINNNEEITESNISNNLYTSGIPDPELIIRTGGENRLSNFLLWQAAYSEIWITPEYWPEFNKQLLMAAIEHFSTIDRRFGGLNA